MYCVMALPYKRILHTLYAIIIYVRKFVLCCEWDISRKAAKHFKTVSKGEERRRKKEKRACPAYGANGNWKEVLGCQTRPYILYN